MSMIPVKLLLEKKTMELANSAAQATKDAVEGGLESAFKAGKDLITSAADPAIATLIANLQQQTFKDNIILMNSFMALAGSPGVGTALSAFAGAINKITIEMAMWNAILTTLQRLEMPAWVKDILDPRAPTIPDTIPYVPVGGVTPHIGFL